MSWRLTVDRRPLSIPAYRRLWIASVVSAIGGSFSLIAVPTQLFTLTGSSATIAVASGVSFAALVVASLAGGALADVMDRRRLLLMAQTGLGLSYALLWAQTALKTQSLMVLLLLVAAQGLSFGTIMTAMGATVPRVVPVELLPAASGLSSLVRYSGAIIGPLLAGVLIPVVGLGTLYLFDALALLVVIRAVFRLPPIPPHRPQPDAFPANGTRAGLQVWPDSSAESTRLLAGFGHLLANPVLMAVLGVDLAAMVFGMPSALFPELAQHTYGGRPGGGLALGSLYAAYPAGVFAMGLISGAFTDARRQGAWMASAAVVWGFTVMVLGLAPRLWIALVALGLGGAANFLLSTFRNAITQAHGDDRLRGRTQGLLTIVLVGGPQTANVLHGIVGATLGPRTAICGGGLLTVITVVAVTRATPALWRYQPAPNREPQDDTL